MKRVFDIVLAVFGILFLLPVMLMVSLIILLSDGRPIFFKQKRVGRDMQFFILIKFRTMSVIKDAEKGSFDLGGTHRVTRFGKIFRSTKLDELPQLFNVLFGSMSFVGPRPEVLRWVEAYPIRWKSILATIRPGITDFAAIEFSNEESILADQDNPEEYYKDVILPRKLTLYEQYAEKHTLLSDVKIIMMTLRKILVK